MKIITVGILLSSALQSLGQSFAPAPGQPGSTAISKDSSIIVAWASGIEFQRGYLNIADKNLGFASFGLPENALYQAEGNSTDVLSFGDSGIAVLTFNQAIFNGPGPDFAIFENGFTDDYMEFAFVEVSSDGQNFVRFPSRSEIPLDPQLTGFEFSDCRYVNNLAGKYRQGFGTPFDLAELNSPLLDLENITHVKLIDVIGSVSVGNGSFDSQNQLINDPYPTAFEAGGFDLDAVAVIHQKPLGMGELYQSTVVYPNPFESTILLTISGEFLLKIFTITGLLVYETSPEDYSKEIDLRFLPAGIYWMQLEADGRFQEVKLLKK